MKKWMQNHRTLLGVQLYSPFPPLLMELTARTTAQSSSLRVPFAPICRSLLGHSYERTAPTLSSRSASDMRLEVPLLVEQPALNTLIFQSESPGSPDAVRFSLASNYLCRFVFAPSKSARIFLESRWRLSQWLLRSLIYIHIPSPPADASSVL